jgi:hypothetical protein
MRSGNIHAILRDTVTNLLVYENLFDVTVYHVMVVSIKKLMGLLKMVY